MKKLGIINQPISAVIAGLGHMDMVTIADAGLPIPGGTQRIDLALKKGVPAFSGDTGSCPFRDVHRESNHRNGNARTQPAGLRICEKNYWQGTDGRNQSQSFQSNAPRNQGGHSHRRTDTFCQRYSRRWSLGIRLVITSHSKANKKTSSGIRKGIFHFK